MPSTPAGPAATVAFVILRTAVVAPAAAGRRAGEPTLAAAQPRARASPIRSAPAVSSNAARASGTRPALHGEAVYDPRVATQSDGHAGRPQPPSA